MPPNSVCSSTLAGSIIHIATSFNGYSCFLLTGPDSPYHMVMSNLQGTSGPQGSGNCSDVPNLPGQCVEHLSPDAQEQFIPKPRDQSGSQQQRGEALTIVQAHFLILIPMPALSTNTLSSLAWGRDIVENQTKTMCSSSGLRERF